MDYDIAHGDMAGGELKLTKHLLEKHRITLGTEYRENFRQAQQSYMQYNVPVVTQTFVDYNRNSHLWGVYGEGEFQLHKNLILNAGVRNDRYNYFGSTTNPRAALIYTPRKTTTLKLLAGSAFRAPSFSELYYVGMDSIAAPTLKPETIRSYEVVWEQQLGKRMTLGASGFYNRIGRYIEEQTVIVSGRDRTSLVNSNGNAKGIELEVRGKLPSNLEGRMSYSLQEARNTLTGASLLDSPRHLGKVNIDAPLFRGLLTAGIEAQYMSRCLSLFSPTGYSSTPALVNATLLTRPLPRGFSLSVSVYNLVGRSMGDPLAPYAEQNHTVPAVSLLPDDRRSFRFKLTWTSQVEPGNADRAGGSAPPPTRSHKETQ
jgi:iron complex outermembrane receptor protein